jgi:hypothetical protein
MVEPKGPPSLKEYWSDPRHDRRRAESAGRRQSDYAVCHLHDGKCMADEKFQAAVCDKIKVVRDELVHDIDQRKADHEADLTAVFTKLDAVQKEKAPMWFVKLLIGLAVLTFGYLAFENRSVNAKIDKLINIHMVAENAKKLDSY